jgi:hypothetical protein
VAALQQAVQTLNTAITQLTAVVNSQNALITQLQQQNQNLQATLGCMSKTGDDVYFTGCNVHIVSGSRTGSGAPAWGPRLPLVSLPAPGAKFWEPSFAQAKNKSTPSASHAGSRDGIGHRWRLLRLGESIA